MTAARWRCGAALLASAMAIGGCTGTQVERFVDPRLPALRAMGYRIAVVPFAVSAAEENFLASSLGPVGEVFALEGSAHLPDRSMLGEVMRGMVIPWLRQSAFEVLEPWDADTRLAHAGFDRAAMADPARAAEVAAVLQVDGVLYGDVQRWNRSYYVVQSSAEVGLRLDLRDAGTGASLFTTTRLESVGSGVTGGPTGFVSAATEPVAGLRGSHLRELMRSVARNGALDLGGDDPGALAQVPAGGDDGVPRLSLVSMARAHPGPLRAGERIDVVAVGSPDCEVRFDLGRLRLGAPMAQIAVAPDPRGARATYAGHYVVQANDPAVTVPLFCTIRRPHARGRVTHYRWDGEVELQAAATTGR